MSHYKNKKNRF